MKRISGWFFLVKRNLGGGKAPGKKPAGKKTSPFSPVSVRQNHQKTNRLGKSTFFVWATKGNPPARLCWIYFSIPSKIKPKFSFVLCGEINVTVKPWGDLIRKRKQVPFVCAAIFFPRWLSREGSRFSAKKTQVAGRLFWSGGAQFISNILPGFKKHCGPGY